jgi:predicted nucleic acid-binding protein
MERGEIAFVDTNVLLSATDSAPPDHHIARAVFEKSIPTGVHLAVSGQVVREYLGVATRAVAATPAATRAARNRASSTPIFLHRPPTRRPGG